MLSANKTSEVWEASEVCAIGRQTEPAFEAVTRRIAGPDVGRIANPSYEDAATCFLTAP